MSDTFYCELDDGLISFGGDDAAAFLHAQLTSDVAGLNTLSTQYSGYCSPKGRLLATFLLWRLEDEIVLQLPGSLRESVQTRIGRYVLRSKVKVADAAARLKLFGVGGAGAASAVAALTDRAPTADHQVASAGALRIVRLPHERYLIVATAEAAATVRSKLDRVCAAQAAARWAALDVESGVPVITPGSEDAYVPQMVNLDLVGGVSYSKGCYPGQEIVARTHYLGRLKQRMYRIRVRGVDALEVGAPLYSPEFGAGQASGTILYAGGRSGDGAQALAVIQKASADARSVHLAALDGPPVEFLPLPYILPE
jgi:folate-binding protein YgfZ